MNRGGHKTPTAKVLLFDVETTPIVTYTWGMYEDSAIKIIEEWWILCFAYKWLGEKKTRIVAQPDFKLYKKDKKNDLEVIKVLHKLFAEADITIAHNGDKFDNRKANARFIFHKLPQPEPYRTLDTLKVARKHFAFTSNKLDDLGNYFGVGRKLHTGGFELWQRCMDGDLKAWELMKKYNRQDVDLLEKVYLKLRPWAENHPSVAFIQDRPDSCPKCGHSRLVSKGLRYTRTSKFRRWQCANCFGYCQSRLSEKSERPNLV